MTGIGTRGAIAAGHPKTVEAGIEMLRQGGNAFDAAIAAVLAACVLEPTLASLGGGGFLLAHTANRQNILFDFFTQTPLQKNTSSVDFYPVGVDFGTVVQEFHVGLGSMAVPGVPAGLFHVHQRLGRLPLKAIAEPAIQFARDGVELLDFQAFCFKILEPILMAAPEMRAICAIDDMLMQAGAWTRNPKQAEAIAHLVEAGSRAFYEGEIAQRIAKDCAELGGYLTLEDFRNYQVIERQPLKTTYRGTTLLTNPPPSSGGALIAFSMGLMSELDFGAMGFGSLTQVRSLAEVMRLTNHARSDGYDSHLNAPDVVEQFLSAEHLQAYRQKFSDVNKWGSTTHISVLDGEGNAASVTVSNGEGSSYMIPGTGIMMNNMLGEADLHPGGFHQWQENVRISSMMSPTIVLNQHRLQIVLGSGGSNRIRTAILQVISNILDHQMSVETAVNSPRIHWENGVMNLEPGFANLAIDRTQFPFNKKLVQWEQESLFFGGVHTVFAAADGSLSGAGDRRRRGTVAVL
jgi:gamma-glutamyltranspeptidase/glutathione hydrolase